MPSEKASAIVLRVADFSETSCVATLFTREFGKVRGIAKGARRLKGPFDSALDLLSVCRVVFLRKQSDVLDILTEARLERSFRPRAKDLSCLNAGYYVGELLREMTDDYDAHPELYDAAEQTLADLSAGTTPVFELTLRFELVLLQLLGHLPSLSTCAECGTPIPLQGKIHFAHLCGGVICTRCRAGKPQVATVTPAVIAVLQAWSPRPSTHLPSRPSDTIGAPSHRDVSELLGSRATCGALRGLMAHYIAHLVGHPLRMHRYLTTDPQR
ncbi:MAG: DNA repair protein RecO [Pirellulales bacterium]|nr:DNA repair protein RecO [Planctomycetales bacterium]